VSNALHRPITLRAIVSYGANAALLATVLIAAFGSSIYLPT
jgi:hypothetical protein